MAKLDCIARNIVASELDSNEFSRISECKSAKEMWDTLKAIHGNITESKELKTRNQERRKRVEKASTSASWPKRKMIQAV